MEKAVLSFQLKTWVLVVSLLPMLASAEIYRWTDANGKTHYSDKAPPGVKAEKKTYVNVATPWRKIPKREVPDDEELSSADENDEENTDSQTSENAELSEDSADKKDKKKTKRLGASAETNSFLSDANSTPARLNQKDKSSSTPAKRASDIKKAYKKAKQDYNKTN